MKTTEQNNRMIAEFMGFVSTNSCIRDGETGKYYDFHGHNNFPCIKETEICIESEWGYGLVEADYLFLSDLKFHTSWDWLMPVVEQIESLGYDTELIYRLDDGEHCFYINDSPVFSSQMGDKKSATYQAVCQFIEWCNKNK